ncbi:MAG: UPF0149 family protein [Burkholderiales bacterium]|nr:UPF0149 family protein [Burkholderiales bacterium]
MAARKPRVDPLTESELDELDRFLLSSATPEDSMDLEELDGFIAGLVCSPVAVGASEWLSLIWGDTEDGRRPVRFASAAQCRRILELLDRHWATIAWTLHSGMPTMPILFEYKSGPPVSAADRMAELVPGSTWAIGFMRAVGLHADDWQDAFDDDAASESLTPIVTLAHADDREIVEQPLSAQQVESLIEELPDSTLELHQFWHPRGSGPEERAPVRKPPKLKPADPCPCCSGRPFARCCGATGSLN